MVGLTIKLTPNPAASNIAVAIIPTNCMKPWPRRAGSNGMSTSGKSYILKRCGKITFYCHSRESGSPEGFEKTGFLLEFTPYLIRGRNDILSLKRRFSAAC
jgi:hypothetical protein